MRLQHVLPLPFGQNGDNVAALQHNFPKAVIQCGLIGRNPNRPYAAPVTDVSHAGRPFVPSTDWIVGAQAG